MASCGNKVSPLLTGDSVTHPGTLRRILHSHGSSVLLPVRGDHGMSEGPQTEW